MDDRNWETDIALLLLAAFIFVAVSLLVADKVQLVHAWTGFFHA